MRRNGISIALFLCAITQISSYAVSAFTCDRLISNTFQFSSKGFLVSTDSMKSSNTKFHTQRKRNDIQMHFGHSHSHHHHIYFNSKDSELTTWKKIFHSSRRSSSRIVLSAIMTLVPPLILRNQWVFACRITRFDFVTFLATSIILTHSESIEREINTIFKNAKHVWDGIRKYKQPNTIEDSNKRKSQYCVLPKNAADRVTFIGLAINLILSLGKGIVGITCHSSALITDAGHSLSDILSDFITLWSVHFGRLPPDEDHPFGRGKFESIGSLFLSLTLLVTGISLGAVSNKRLTDILSIQFASVSQGQKLVLSASHLMPEVPTFPCLIMALASVLSKEWLYRITKDVGERLNSKVVIANAWHHRSDAYSSILALISIGIAMTFPSLIAVDCAAGLLVAGMICMTGFEILIDSIKNISDN